MLAAPVKKKVNLNQNDEFQGFFDFRQDSPLVKETNHMMMDSELKMIKELNV